MGSGSFRQVEVRCPFYRYDDGYGTIVCEGFLQGSNQRLVIRRKKDYERQMKVFCCESYERCEQARMLMEKYRDE